ncbi:cytochrome d ubiquinol oxidase subunit II [[Erwinia] mediterraneensis]|uniref:cytochrome d ubiquinol oxidase subunit II n=1 Tax=[Erwinia] mediterraneensis TaxID=2161819 RepID=UPI00103265C6|nr:cytochrome d ubiquinol oxidase subunit II [[Erwinia] mediterraneensis]
MIWLADLSAATLLFSLLIYMMLDGTDLGVGMLFICFKQEEQKRPMVQSMLPIWDANETWLVLLAGGMLALFPAAYGLLLSALYIPLFLMLFSLLLRAMALEYRGTATGGSRRWLDLLLPFTSALATFCQGACAGVVVSGNVSRGTFGWLDLYPVLSGFGLMSIYLLLGCCWIRWRIGARVEEQASQLVWIWLVLSLVLFIGLQLLEPAPWRRALQLPLGQVLSGVIALLWLLLLFALRRSGALTQLIITLLLMVSVVLLLATGLYPWLIPEVAELHYSAASATTQSFVLVGLAFVMPLTLIYHSWAFWVFRGQVE